MVWQFPTHCRQCLHIQMWLLGAKHLPLIQKKCEARSIFCLFYVFHLLLTHITLTWVFISTRKWIVFPNVMLSPNPSYCFSIATTHIDLKQIIIYMSGLWTCSAPAVLQDHTSFNNASFWRLKVYSFPSPKTPTFSNQKQNPSANSEVLHPGWQHIQIYSSIYIKLYFRFCRTRKSVLKKKIKEKNTLHHIFLHIGIWNWLTLQDACLGENLGIPSTAHD